MKQRADMTFKQNREHSRHRWLRLTPAYSAKLVREILDGLESPGKVLDPFSGTGTTGLVCGERGIDCDLLELNPFLAWFAEAKTRNYSEADRAAAVEMGEEVRAVAPSIGDAAAESIPPIKNAERWWGSRERLLALASIRQAIELVGPAYDEHVVNLNKIAFCRVVVEWSNAAFNHQSLSFKKFVEHAQERDILPTLLESLQGALELVLEDAATSVSGKVNVLQGDSRRPAAVLPGRYDTVITSPPYPNRMSYVRELRPYMYWLGFLVEAREAADLDWDAIGGTWGVATSRLNTWSSPNRLDHNPDFMGQVSEIAETSPLLANYVHRYFVDMESHIESLATLLQPRAELFYVVGNVKFYDTMVPVERLFESIMREFGLEKVHSEVLRKRNSKKELFEYVVRGTTPS